MKRALGFSGVLLGFLLLVTAANADILVSQTGMFTQDDNHALFNFSLASSTDVTLQTWSFAGGTNASAKLISDGGFAPVLSLFDAAGNLLGYDAGGVAPGSCSPRNIDLATGFCLDAFMMLNLSAGDYFAVLTEYDNLPIGETYADGFFYDGLGDFTGGPFFLNAGSGFQRDGNWAVDITTPSVATVPEPGTLVLMLSMFPMGPFVFATQKKRFQKGHRGWSK